MPRARAFVKYWLPVIIWMAIIFAASTGAGSVTHTSRFLGPFIQWLLPSLSQAQIGDIVFSIRKCSHAFEYAVLAILVWRARRQTRPEKSHTQKVAAPRRKPWSWNDARFAFAVSALYAVTDEFHQRFVATRQASLWDVLLDSAGAAIGLLLLWRAGKLFRKW